MKIDEQQQQQVQPSSRTLSKPSPSSSSKLMNHILRNKLNVSSSIAKRKDESMQTTTTNNNNNNNNDSNSSNNYRSSSSNSNTLTSKLERELYELKKTFETKRRENETLSGALMEVTNEVKQIDHETSEMYEKSAKLAELSNLNYASANRYKNEVDLLKRELKENRKTLENALSGEAEALEEVNTEIDHRVHQKRIQSNDISNARRTQDGNSKGFENSQFVGGVGIRRRGRNRTFTGKDTRDGQRLLEEVRRRHEREECNHETLGGFVRGIERVGFSVSDGNGSESDCGEFCRGVVDDQRKFEE